MAYATLVSLEQTIHKLLNHDQHPTSLHGKQNIKCLHERVIFFQEFFDDFPEKLDKNLEARIRDVVNEAEDIVESFMSEEIRLSLELAQHQPALRLRYDLQKLNQELAKLTKEIDLIVGDVMEIKNNAVIGDLQHSDSSAATPSSGFPPTSKDAMVGFDDDLLAIKERLCGESSNLQVIPIVGMGGIGKTTLAKNVFDDRLTVEHFDIRAWVTVSQHYSAEEILTNILDFTREREESAEEMHANILDFTKERDESAEEILANILDFTKERDETNDEVEEKKKSTAEIVYKSLKGRRYLIVMDDIWSTKVWDDVKMIFPDDHNGSRVMLTTRLSNVATYPYSSGPLHEMKFMDADQSWDLFKQKVFLKENCPPEMETIGKEIARSCRGLPLAIVLIAGLVTTVKKTRSSWENIARNVNEAVWSTNNEEFGKRVLSLSYNHLPHYLRPCFLYMGGFPEDYEIRVSRLIKLWAAEGFLRPNDSKSFEEVAEEYLEDLVKRSLVLVINRKANGKIKCCIVHDLLRDLCIRKAKEEKFHLNIMNEYVLGVVHRIKNQRRVVIAHSHPNFLQGVHGSTIRTIVCFQRDGRSLGFLGSFRLLRVLDVVDGLTFVSLPLEVFELFHLRYLAFDYPARIPATISNLKNLQTLIINHPRRRRDKLQFVVCLPSAIWRMPQLRHLVSSYLSLLPNPVGATFSLENLQTISMATNFVCNERILKMIPNVKKLGISYVGAIFVDDRHVSVGDYHLNNLVHLHQLEKLKLKIYHGFKGKLNPVFPRTLKRLALNGLQLPWEDMGIVGMLPNLEVLKLKHHACIGDKWETSEGEFQSLKFLLIKNSDPKQWITESSHFPSLQCLVLHSCRYLREIPDDIGEILALELVEVDYLNESLLNSAKRIQKEQQSYGNDALQVRWVRH